MGRRAALTAANDVMTSRERALVGGSAPATGVMRENSGEQRRGIYRCGHVGDALLAATTSRLS